MNTSIIRYIVGYILKIEAKTFTDSFHCSRYLPRTGGVMLSLCFRSVHLPWCTPLFPKTEKSCFYLKEGCVATSLSWIVLSFLVPFHFTDR